MICISFIAIVASSLRYDLRDGRNKILSSISQGSKYAVYFTAKSILTPIFPKKGNEILSYYSVHLFNNSEKLYLTSSPIYFSFEISIENK